MLYICDIYVSLHTCSQLENFILPVGSVNGLFHLAGLAEVAVLLRGLKQFMHLM
jgi:hypothetical protein